MFHILYKTINKVNGKYYVGVHSTSDLSDGYLGSGVGIKNAINKYGKESFEREILHQFDNEDDMYLKEAEIVTLDFIRDKQTYNQALGGDLNGNGGWKQWNSLPHDLRFTEKRRKQLSDQSIGEKNGFHGKQHSEETRAHLREVRKDMYHGEDNTFYGKKHSDVTKKRISQSWIGPNGDRRRKLISKAMTGYQHKTKTCPHCDLEGAGPNMSRYHFDNCKSKP